MSEQTSQADFAPVVRVVFDDLDMQQLVALRRLLGAQRLQMAFEMCQALRERIAASVLARNPDISPEELNRRVAECIMMGCTYF